MDEFTYYEAEKFNISSDMKAPLVSNEPQIDVSNKIHGIQNGVKCVPASRFKHKVRQTIKNMNGVGERIEMDDLHPLERIRWSDQICSFKEVKKLLGEEKPLLVQLESGFSNEDLELSRSQILFINEYGLEKRASVVHENGPVLSFPLEFSIKILHNKKEYVCFKELISAVKKFPLEVELKNNHLNNLDIQHLVLQGVKEYIFFKACTIVYGWIDQSELLVLPELSQIEFRTAKGMRNAVESEWREYKYMLQRSTRHLRDKTAVCYPGILYEKERNSVVDSKDDPYYNVDAYSAIGNRSDGKESAYVNSPNSNSNAPLASPSKQPKQQTAKKFGRAYKNDEKPKEKAENRSTPSGGVKSSGNLESDYATITGVDSGAYLLPDSFTGPVISEVARLDSSAVTDNRFKTNGNDETGRKSPRQQHLFANKTRSPPVEYNHAKNVNYGGAGATESGVSNGGRNAAVKAGERSVDPVPPPGKYKPVPVIDKSSEQRKDAFSSRIHAGVKTTEAKSISGDLDNRNSSGNNNPLPVAGKPKSQINSPVKRPKEPGDNRRKKKKVPTATLR